MNVRLDPALATVIVAAIGLLGFWFATRATRSGKAKEDALARAPEERADRDEQFAYMERSRDAATEDADRARAERDRMRADRDASEAHNALLIQARISVGQPVPSETER